MRPGRVGGEVQHIPVTSRSHLVGQLVTDGLGEGVNHFKYGAAQPGAQVPGSHSRVLRTEVVQGFQMAISQVENVDVVPDTCTIARVIVL